MIENSVFSVLPGTDNSRSGIIAREHVNSSCVTTVNVCLQRISHRAGRSAGGLAAL